MALRIIDWIVDKYRHLPEADKDQLKDALKDAGEGFLWTEAITPLLVGIVVLAALAIAAVVVKCSI